MSNSTKIVQTFADIYDPASGQYTFDNSKFYREDVPWYSWFTSPYVPFGSMVLYLILTKPLFRYIRDSYNIKPKGFGLQTLTIVHSAALALYSGWTAYNSIPIVYNYIMENGGGVQGLTAALCDVNGDLWFKKDLSFWATHFYISKLYEFIDTFIVILKGKNPIFLQTFHHAGILVLMWALVAASSSLSLVIVCLNSSIHFMMYTYYTLAAFGFRTPFKNYLTQAQIVQFVVGISVTVPYLFKPGCLTSFEKVSLACLHAYTLTLIFLFGSFYVSSYMKSANEKRKKEI